jgi:TonB family protein
MILISREDVMTAKRLMLSAIGVVAVTAVGGWYIVDAFPLRETAGEQILQKTPGPLETSANPITPENPVPRRVRHEPAQYPAEAAAENASASVTLRITIDVGGGVAEARVAGFTLRMRNSRLWYDGLPAQYERTQDWMSPVVRATVDAAVAAVSRWQYEAPANGPIAFETTFFFSPERSVTDTPGGGEPPPPPPPPPPGTATRLQDDKALRVGGNIHPPMKIKDVRPVYPPEAQAARIQGVVLAEIRIDEAGRVSDATIVRSIPELDEAALAAIRQWEFQPVLLNGAAVPVIMVVTINFSLK